MKLTFITSLVLLLFLIGRIDASCTASNATCETGSGDYTSAVRLALQGDLVAAGNAAFYGKYCGNLNKCQVVAALSSSSEDANTCEVDDEPRSRLLEKKTKGKKQDIKMDKKSGDDDDDDASIDDPCPAIACDEIDKSCSLHDSCLDNQVLINPPPNGERLQIPQRCQCDVNLVYAMALEVSTPPTGLCDDAFYTEPIAPGLPVTGIQLLQHESVFVAAPFCCDILKDVDGNGVPECQEDSNTDGQKAGVAVAFCHYLLDSLADAQIFICASI